MTELSNSLSYVAGSSGPDALVWWLDPSTDSTIDFTGWTMTAAVTDRGGTASFSVGTVIYQAGTGDGRESADVANVVIQWAATAELSTLVAGKYTLTITATNDTDSSVRKREIQIIIT